MTSVTLGVAQKKLPKLIEGVLLGGHVVITKDKKPVARLVPVGRAVAKASFGSARGLITMADDFDAPLEDFAEYVR